jgi:cytoplasmic tRNA 2-thiolation protein 1
MCKDCFLRSFEEEVHQTILETKLFSPGEVVAIGVSGGKGIALLFGSCSIAPSLHFSDSTCLLHVLYELNKRYNYGIDLRLLAIDEGIAGYRDFSLKCVQENAAKYNLPLHILSYTDLYGFTMDQVNQFLGPQKSKCVPDVIFFQFSLFPFFSLCRHALWCLSPKGSRNWLSGNQS